MKQLIDELEGEFERLTDLKANLDYEQCFHNLDKIHRRLEKIKVKKDTIDELHSWFYYREAHLLIRMGNIQGALNCFINAERGKNYGQMAQIYRAAIIIGQQSGDKSELKILLEKIGKKPYNTFNDYLDHPLWNFYEILNYASGNFDLHLPHGVGTFNHSKKSNYRLHLFLPDTPRSIYARFEDSLVFQLAEALASDSRINWIFRFEQEKIKVSKIRNSDLELKNEYPRMLNKRRSAFIRDNPPTEFLSKGVKCTIPEIILSKLFQNQDFEKLKECIFNAEKLHYENNGVEETEVERHRTDQNVHDAISDYNKAFGGKPIPESYLNSMGFIVILPSTDRVSALEDE